MKQMKRPATRLLTGFGLSILAAASVNAQSVLFWSTQATPVNEQKNVREVVLKNSPVPVEFVTNNDGPYFTRLNAELQAGKGSIGLLGALHGGLSSNTKDLQDLSKLGATAKVSPAFAKLANSARRSKSMCLGCRLLL